MCIPFTADVSSQDNNITPQPTFRNLSTAPAGVLTSGSQGIYMCIYMQCVQQINCVSFFLQNLQSNTTARQLQKEHLQLPQKLMSFLRKAIPPVQPDTVAVPAPLQVRGHRNHHLGVGVASVHSSASSREVVQHPSPQQAPSPILTSVDSPMSSSRNSEEGFSLSLNK